MKNPGDIYQKIVAWGEEDNCFIGMCPELFHGGVHGDDALEVFKELNEVVDEWIEIFKKDSRPLPEPKSILKLEAA
jgi:predicted RNase H-like HicB family nuclease